MPETTYPGASWSIKQWAEDDRPREKMISKGKSALSDAELVALLISTGTKKESAVDVGKRILQTCGSRLTDLGRLSVKDLTKVKGVGEAKALRIAAALELGRRRKDEEAHERPLVSSSRDAYNYFESLVEDKVHEEFWILLLNRNNRVIGRTKISEGGVHGTVVDPKIIFRHALEALASSVVLCHNHPSGNIRPSEQDIRLTQKIKEAGKFLEVNVLDHIIVGEKSYFSFSDEGML
jgi:DNA repair protein RadC